MDHTRARSFLVLIAAWSDEDEIAVYCIGDCPVDGSTRILAFTAVRAIHAIVGDVPSDARMRHATVLKRGFIILSATALHCRE